MRPGLPQANPRNSNRLCVAFLVLGLHALDPARARWHIREPSNSKGELWLQPEAVL